ncbi:dnaJ homolog subfamily C member 24-like isoform X2 [Carassius carassius]|uniref:dnaJ homolog subfamily C member 24-like isoform X2 n=1 Tax=Carassius carassius TaxID=217509 RepID=UPI002868E511|nr:dnaJ homolog subfamily C member 24-like isoform X2 [Carassius carassius]
MIMADSSGPQKNWYSILGACPTDGIQELKQKYQKLILMFHPDKQRPDISEGEAEQHIQRFIDVGQAWKILSNEESRKKYNLQLRGIWWPPGSAISSSQQAVSRQLRGKQVLLSVIYDNVQVFFPL